MSLLLTAAGLHPGRRTAARAAKWWRAAARSWKAAKVKAAAARSRDRPARRSCKLWRRWPRERRTRRKRLMAQTTIGPEKPIRLLKRPGLQGQPFAKVHHGL